MIYERSSDTWPEFLDSELRRLAEGEPTPPPTGDGSRSRIILGTCVLMAALGLTLGLFRIASRLTLPEAAPTTVLVVPPNGATVPVNSAVIELPAFGTAADCGTSPYPPKSGFETDGGVSRDDAERRLGEFFAHVGKDQRIVGIVVGTHDVHRADQRGPSNTMLAQARAECVKQWLAGIFDARDIGYGLYAATCGATDRDATKACTDLASDREPRLIVVAVPKTASDDAAQVAGR
jgi:hypothetical protein